MGTNARFVSYCRVLVLVIQVLALQMTAFADTRHDANCVEVRRVCPGIRLELRYATSHNGVGKAVYPKRARCLLRKAVAERLCRVQRRLQQDGYSLLIWDAYRPLSAQKALWQVKSDPKFVAPPAKGSKHNRGAAMDVTLTRNGRPLPMPSEFDEFSPRARAKYSGGTPDQRRNRDRLREAMTAEGFQGDLSEWWHFQDPDWKRYPLADVPLVLPAKKR